MLGGTVKKNEAKKLNFKKNTVSNLEKTDLIKIKGGSYGQGGKISIGYCTPSCEC
jgi:natural product precursor